MSKKKTSKTIENVGMPNVAKGNTPLTPAEVYNVLEFAQEYYKAALMKSNDSKNSYPMTFTPQLTNQRLSSIGVSRETTDTFDYKSAFANLIDSQESLVGYSEFLGLTDAVSKRTASYLGNLPAFDYTFVCTNAYDEKDYKSEEYKEDLKAVKQFLAHFNPQAQFISVHRRTLKTDAYFGVFRTDYENFSFQELPYDYCKIVGRNPDWGYIFDFDMEWFLHQGLSINQYPSAFKRLWRNAFGGNVDITDYNPANPLKNRNGSFSLWAQTSPLPSEGNFVCFKFNSDIFATIPFLTTLFGDAANKDLVRALQNDAYIIASQKILIGLIPLLKEQKSGAVRDAVAISPKTMGAFLGLLKQGLSNAVKISGVPFSDVKDISFSLPTTNMYDQYNASEASNAGATSRFVYTSDKLSAAEVKYNALIDQMISEQVYPQYSVWLSTMINGLTKKYKFAFTFVGTRFDREERLNQAEKLANRGIFIDQLYASAIGKNKFELEALMLMSKHSSFYDLLRLPPNANTKSLGGEDVDGSGHTKPVEEVAESTERKADYGGGEGV